MNLKLSIKRSSLTENKAYHWSRQYDSRSHMVYAFDVFFKTPITYWLTITYWFSTRLKVSMKHNDYSCWAFDYAILVWNLDPDCLILEQYPLCSASFSLLEKWFSHLRQYCFASLYFEVWLGSSLLMLFIRQSCFFSSSAIRRRFMKCFLLSSLLILNW